MSATRGGGRQARGAAVDKGAALFEEERRAEVSRCGGRKSRETGAALIDALGEDLPGEWRGDALELSLLLAEMAQRTGGQFGGGEIEALTGDVERSPGRGNWRRQRAGGRGRWRDAGAAHCDRAGPDRRHRRVRPVPAQPFRRRRWGRRTLVGGEIDKCRIGLVADA